MPLLVIIAISALIAVGRFLVPGHGLSWPGTYEAFAHIWVGVLLSLAFLRRQCALLEEIAVPAVCAVLITALEIVMFFIDNH